MIKKLPIYAGMIGLIALVMFFVNLFRGDIDTMMTSLYIFIGCAAVVGVFKLIDVLIEKAENKKNTPQTANRTKPAEETKPAPAAPAAPPAPATLPPSATPCAWMESPEAIKILSAIQKTWFVEAKAYQLSEEDAKALEQQFPLAKPVQTIQAQYAVEQSGNSIFWHEHGAWIDFSYAKFLYQDRLYYVSVSPMVQLTAPMYNRMSDLDHMAKILLCLNKQAGAGRDRLLITLNGSLKQNAS